MTGSETPAPFRLVHVPGATPGKWVRIWNERLPGTPLALLAVPAADASEALREGRADAGIVRLPVDRTIFSAIPLYTETTVVVVPKDHLITAADEVTVDDLVDEVVFHPLDDVLDWPVLPGRPAIERPATTEDAVELVAAGVGVLIVPQSLARLYHRKDLTYRTVLDAPQSGIALAWPESATTDLVEEFIGIVRGRTVNSTRGRSGPSAQSQEKRGQKPAEGKKSTDGKKPATGKKAATGKKPTTARTRGGSTTGGSRRGRPRRRS
ncbi:LysR family substrate-binding domain-containing protein [Streptomyces sp. NPDC048290]|uniref:LysR family substrate-binding domain-containing protein n=1 Tax=Streptomyces sp. NPDC048290 TaxID=3155811 RepID=UPI00341CBD6D